MAKPVFNGRVYAHDVLAYVPWDGELWAITIGFRGHVKWAPESCVVYPLGFATEASYREPTYLEIREIYEARIWWEEWTIENCEDYGPLGFWEQLRINAAKDYQELDLLYRLLDRNRWERRRVIAEMNAEVKPVTPRQAPSEEQRRQLREALKNWLR